MKKPNINEGIVQSGGKIEANQIVVGRGARAASISPTADKESEHLRQQLQTSVALLIETIEAHRGDFTNSKQVLETAQLLNKEAEASTPNKLTLTAILEGIGKAAASVSAIGGSVAAVQKIIGLLH